MAIWDSGLMAKMNRLRSLLVVGNANAPHIQVEISDLRRDILGNGVSEAELKGMTAPGVNGGF